MPWRKGNKLKLVREADADDRIRSIYEDIKVTLGVPYVNVIFQAYAAYPEFLEKHWRAFMPILEKHDFFELADRLRGEAYTRMHNYFAIPDLCAHLTQERLSPGVLEELTAVVELFHYNNPPLLLLAAAQLQAFEVRVGRERPQSGPADHAVFTTKPALIEEETAPPEVRHTFEEMKRTLVVPLINTDFRAFARWPDFFTSYWEALKPILESPVYSESQQGMRESAWSLAREIPGTIDLTVSHLIDDGLNDDQLADVIRITDLFVRILSDLVLDVAVAKIGMEGGNRKPQRPERPVAQPEQAA